MTRWPACRQPRIEPILKPEVLHWQCRLDGGAYEARVLQRTRRHTDAVTGKI
jgi:hypothetical protein